MTVLKYRLIQITSIFGLLFFFQDTAYAYLDPGTGSIILQGLIAGIAVGLSTIKLWWHRLVSLFSSRKSEADQHLDD